MDNEELYRVIDRYFRQVTLEGYCDYDKVYSIIAIIAIFSMLKGELKEFNTECDIKLLNETLVKLRGNKYDTKF